MTKLRGDLTRPIGANQAEMSLQELTICTIHQFCYQLVSQFHHQLLFLRGIFRPLGETQRLLLLFRSGYEFGLKPVYAAWKENLDYNNDLFHFYQDVGNVFDFVSEDVIGGGDPRLVDGYLKRIYAGAEGVAKFDVEDQIIRAYPRYWAALIEEGFLDNSMVLAYVCALLDDPHVLTTVRERYTHVFVDEYQDTNPIQDSIFRKIAGESGNLVVVGDEDQAIYGFRGADVRNFSGFKNRYPDADEQFLSESRRSTPEIVAAAKDLIRRNTKARYQDKPLTSLLEPGAVPWRVDAEDEDDLPDATLSLVKHLRESGFVGSWRDIAILFRTRGKSYRKHVDTLEDDDIPVHVGATRGFLARPVVNAFVGILEMIAGDADAITTRKRKHRPLFESVGLADRDQALELVRGWHRRFRDKNQGYQSLIDLFYSILRDSGARECSDVLEDMGRLSAVIAEAEQEIRNRDLGKRLSWLLSYLAAAKGEIEGPLGEKPDADGVQVMTMHASKGLQFPVVIIPEAIEERLPFLFPENPRDALRRRLGGSGPAGDPLEEERRVLYVAMTRAEHLIAFVTVPGQESPFLSEFKTETVDVRRSRSAMVAPFRPRRASHTPPLRLTHSQLSTYEYCPQRFRLEHRLGFAGRAGKSVQAGQTLHKALEIFHRLLADGSRLTGGRIRPSGNGRGTRSLPRLRRWDAPNQWNQGDRAGATARRRRERSRVDWESRPDPRT